MGLDHKFISFVIQSELAVFYRWVDVETAMIKMG